MNTDTLDKMRRLRLLGMHRAFKTSLETPGKEPLTTDETIAMLIDSEWDDRHNRAIARSMTNARFRYKATMEQLDYSGGRGIDKTSFTAAFSYGETDDGLPRPDLLKKIAEASKGEYLSINDWNEKSFEKIAARLEAIAPSEIVEQRQTRLWSNLWPFGVILALLSVEWWMRRK